MLPFSFLIFLLSLILHTRFPQNPEQAQGLADRPKEFCDKIYCDYYFHVRAYILGKEYITKKHNARKNININSLNIEKYCRISRQEKADCTAIYE